MRKKIILALVVLLSIFALVACSGGSDQAANEEQESADVVTTASIVDEESAFKEAISADGNWIIATLNDLTFEEAITVEGNFYDGGNPENDLYRKIAAYAQDDEYNVTDRYTITAPEMHIKSPNTRFQSGTFVGNIIVKANDFTLYDATVEGNIFFSRKEYKNSAEITEDSKVTGNIKVKN